MDGRWSLWLAGGVLGGLLGCSTSSRSRSDSVESMIAAAKAQNRKDVEIETPYDGSVKPLTAYTMGQIGEKMAADPAKSPAEQQALRAQARHSYLLALELDPKYLDAHLTLARSYDATGEHDQALAAYQKAAKQLPNNAALWYELGACQAKGKDWNGAADSMVRAATLEPNNPQYLKTLGFTLARAGRSAEALAQLRKCMGEAEAHYNLARMMHHLRQPDACQGELRLALQADAGYGPAREFLAELGQTADPPAPVRTVQYEEPVLLPAAPAQPAPEARPAAVEPQRLPPVLAGGRSLLPPEPPPIPGRKPPKADVGGIE